MDTGREPGGGGEKPLPSSETRRDRGDPEVRSTQNNLQGGPLGLFSDCHRALRMCLCPQRLAREALKLAQERSRAVGFIRS